jgi:hypothetical protein
VVATEEDSNYGSLEDDMYRDKELMVKTVRVQREDMNRLLDPGKWDKFENKRALTVVFD